MSNTFRKDYRELTDEEKVLVDLIKIDADALLNHLNIAKQTREISLAKTKLEECVMWATKGITG